MNADLNTAIFPGTFRIYPLSEKAITVELGDTIREDTLQRISFFSGLIGQNPFPGFITTVPAYTTLTVFFDPLIVIRSKNLSGTTCFEKVSAWLEGLQQMKGRTADTQTKEITIPVHYGGASGPDLEELAGMHGLSPEEVIRLHCSAAYKVYMIGFVPGFAYLGGLPEILASPRRHTPRSKVPAGSVGIAGSQTGIYPIEIPGGWQIIGRTSVELFRPDREEPALLKAGDIVRFQSVSLPDLKFYQP